MSLSLKTNSILDTSSMCTHICTTKHDIVTMMLVFGLFRVWLGVCDDAQDTHSFAASFCFPSFPVICMHCAHNHYLLCMHFSVFYSYMYLSILISCRRAKGENESDCEKIRRRKIRCGIGPIIDCMCAKWLIEYGLFMEKNKTICMSVMASVHSSGRRC